MFAYGLQCILPIMRCALGAHWDAGLVDQTIPCKFIGIVHVSFPYFRKDGHLLIRLIPFAVSHSPTLARARTHARKDTLSSLVS